MLKLYIALVAMFFLPSSGIAQIRLATNISIGSFTYSSALLRVDPGPGWKGYYLPRDGATGFKLTAGTGIRFINRIDLRLNAGYAKYKDINGLLSYISADADILKTRLTPFVYGNIGYSHFWNQYKGGTGTAMGALGLGLKFHVNKNIFSLSAGNLIMQQNAYWAVQAGYDF